jgi:hypothetical protein
MGDIALNNDVAEPFKPRRLRTSLASLFGWTRSSYALLRTGRPIQVQQRATAVQCGRINFFRLLLMMFARCGRAILTEFRQQEIGFDIIAARYRFLSPSHKNELAALCRLFGSKRDYSILTTEHGTGTGILRLLIFQRSGLGRKILPICPAPSSYRRDTQYSWLRVLILAPRTGP